MAFISASQISAEKTNRGVSGPRLHPHAKVVTVSASLGGKTKTGETRPYQNTIKISEELAKTARILPGDRVDLLFDKDDHLGLIVRVNKGGYAASPIGTPFSKIKDGAFYPVGFKFTCYEGMPLFICTERCENVTVSDEGILFELPKSALFDRKSRFHYLAARPLNSLTREEKHELSVLSIHLNGNDQ